MRLLLPLAPGSKVHFAGATLCSVPRMRIEQPAAVHTIRLKDQSLDSIQLTVALQLDPHVGIARSGSQTEDSALFSPSSKECTDLRLWRVHLPRRGSIQRG